MSNALTGMHQLSAHAQNVLMNAYNQQNAIYMQPAIPRSVGAVDDRELKLYDQYNWGSRITSLDRMYREVEDLQAQIRVIETKIDRARDNIPAQVLELYDQQRTVEALAK